MSSILMGLQERKEDPATPPDYVGKNFFYLDVDALFANPDNASVNAGFQKVMETHEHADAHFAKQPGFPNHFRDRRQ
jgi:hypothetical protein